MGRGANTTKMVQHSKVQNMNMSYPQLIFKTKFILTITKSWSYLHLGQYEDGVKCGLGKFVDITGKVFEGMYY